jgi:molybdopterin-guanine dinucleotide biosynthesis protein A
MVTTAPTAPTTRVRPAGVLLTGGRSRRMGRDKATIVVDGRPLAERTAVLLGRVAAPVVEVGPGHTTLPRTVESPPGSGPRQAIAAAARWLDEAGHAGPALVVATDLPRLTAGMLDMLAGWPAAGCVVPIDAGRPQPACARYSPAALARAIALAGSGQRSLMALLNAVEVTWLSPGEWLAGAGRPDALADADTADDLAGLGIVP